MREGKAQEGEIFPQNALERGLRFEVRLILPGGCGSPEAEQRNAQDDRARKGSKWIKRISMRKLRKLSTRH
jgi:hypothetical protein